MATKSVATRTGSNVATTGGNRVDREKLVAAAGRSGVTEQQMKHRSLRLPVCVLMLTSAVKNATTEFYSDEKFYGDMSCELNLAILTNESLPLSITVRKFTKNRNEKGAHKAVMARDEIRYRMADLYVFYRSLIRAGSPTLTVMVPLVSPNTNPARLALEEAILQCHTAVRDGKQLSFAIEWVGIDDEQVEPEEVKSTAEAQK